MQKVLVTGASGFLGSNLVKELYMRNYAIKIMVRRSSDLSGITGIPCEVFYGDIDNRRDVYAAVSGCAIVIHAACITDQWGVAFSDYEKVNFLGTKHIADACIDRKVSRLVYVSTANTIGPGNKETPGTELNAFNLFTANSGYINSKYLAQQYILEQVERRQLPAVIVNPTFMIGPNDVKPSSGKLLLYGLKKRVLFYPSGGKNFVHIQDVCAGVINAIHHGKTGACYLMAGHNLSYGEFFQMVNRANNEKKFMIKIPAFVLRLAGKAGSIIARLTGQPVKLNATAAYLLCMNNYYSGKKAERELHIRYTPIEQAIENALDWFRANNYCQ